METPTLDKNINLAAELYTKGIKDQIKSQDIWRTGNLYRSISSTIVPLQTGQEIAVSMLYYGEYVNDGTYAIQPPRRFVELGIERAEEQANKIIEDSLAKDLDNEITSNLQWP
tara:strand:- start:904 stop:1242 length:339 start_codon:yes stop_codon:yes gene_type:complete